LANPDDGGGRVLDVRRLGRRPYGEVHELQRDLLERRIRGEVGDTLRLRPHVHQMADVDRDRRRPEKHRHPDRDEDADRTAVIASKSGERVDKTH